MNLEPCTICAASGRVHGVLCIKCLGSGQLRRLPYSGIQIGYTPLEQFSSEIRPVIARLRTWAEELS